MWSRLAFYLLVTVATGCFAGFAEREKEVVGRQEPKHVYVAFVFAGTPRSLVVGMVHESIRSNLINALCPPPLCHGHSYLRLSRSDNTHVPNDAVGIRSVQKNRTAAILSDKAVNYALNRLKTQDGVMYRHYVDTGGTQELTEMVDYANKFTNASQKLQHDIFRKLDPRRYSMHFNRHMAYTLMKDKEKEATHDSHYDWVVHCRLDTAWSEPINQPIFSFDPNHIYVPSMWYADVPDTFAIIPRHLADIYFDIDLLIKPKVMCLGGPNFDPKTVEKGALLKVGFVHPHELQAVEDALCLNMFYKQGFAIVHEKKTNTTWTSAGYSEYLLKRKLRQAGLDSYRGTDSGHDLTKHSYVIFHTFSLFITRFYPGKGANSAPIYRYVTAGPEESVGDMVGGKIYRGGGGGGRRLASAERTEPASISLVCMYLRSQQFIPFGKTVGPTNDATYPSCLHMQHLHLQQNRNNPMTPSCSVILHRRQRYIDRLRLGAEAQSEVVERECNPLDATSLSALDHQATDHNFMPFRLRFRSNKCITAGKLRPLYTQVNGGAQGDSYFRDEKHAAHTLNLRSRSGGEDGGASSLLLGDRTGMYNSEDSLRRRYRLLKPHIETCINYYRSEELMVQYHRSQLVSLLPLLGATTTPQQVLFFDIDEAHPLCLTMPYHKAASRMAASQGRDWVGDFGVKNTEKDPSVDEDIPKTKKGGHRATELELYLAPCAPFDWQRLRSRPSASVQSTVKLAVHQLFLVDMIESTPAATRRKASQERMHRARTTTYSTSSTDTSARGMNGGPELDAEDTGRERGPYARVEEHALDALTVSMLRWSPSAIAAMAAGDGDGDGEGAIPSAHGSSLGERVRDSGDLCVTASSTAAIHGRSTASTLAAEGDGGEMKGKEGGIAGAAGSQAGLVLRACPVSLTVEENADHGTTEYSFLGSDSLSDSARASPRWLADNASSVQEYYQRSSVVENPFSKDFDLTLANAALMERNSSSLGGVGGPKGMKRKRRGGKRKAEDTEEVASEDEQRRRRLLKKRQGGGVGGGRGGHGRRRKRAGHHSNKLGGLNRFLFVLERTRTNPTPHAPGLVIGGTPRW